MPTETAANLRTKALADWKKAVNDQSALLRDPSQRIKELTDQARQAHDQGVINAEDLRELLEWADAAFAWAEEHRTA
jgi:hypothetical protein